MPIFGSYRNSMPRLLSNPCHVCSPAAKPASLSGAPCFRANSGCRINCVERMGPTHQKIPTHRHQPQSRHLERVGTVWILDFTPSRDLWPQPQWPHRLPSNGLNQRITTKKPPANGRGRETEPIYKSSRRLSNQTIHHNIFLQEECNHRHINDQTHETEAASHNRQQNS